MFKNTIFTAISKFTTKKPQRINDNHINEGINSSFRATRIDEARDSEPKGMSK